MATKMTDSSVAGEEGKSDFLKVAAEARARLITPAKATILFVYTILEFLEQNSRQ